MNFLKTKAENGNVLKYMKQLDGLRAIAVFSVLYTHYLPEKYWLFGIYWGGIGVRLFFVLSGFLITSILLKCRQYIESQQQTIFFTVRQFYIRRFLRLLPLYYVTLAIAYIVNIPPVRETIAWHIPYLSNIYFAIQGEYDASVSHLWSLAVEEQFYLLLPWLILLIHKKFLLPTIIILISIAPLFRLVSSIIGLNQVAIWVMMPNFLDTLGLGSLLAYLNYQEDKFKKSHKKKLLKIFLVVGIFLWIFSNIIKNNNIQFLKIFAIHEIALGLIFTWLIAKASIGFKGLIGKTLELEPLVYLGKISYGIYLLHLFMPYIVKKAFSVFGLSSYLSLPVLTLLSSVATIILATISWHFLEKPINDLKKLFEYSNKQLN
jgi:peptidoglycan/LPS O-acetylase OafA/YrhL